jgi:cell division protein FtsL
MNLEKARKELELKKVETALAEMEFKKLERYSDIERIERNIENQKQRIDELKNELKEI